MYTYTAEEVEFMIEEYCKDRDFVIYKDVIKLFSNVLGEDIFKILRDGNSKFLYDVIGKIDGKEIGRITNRYQSIKVLKKCKNLYEKNTGEKINADEGFEFVNNLIDQLEVKYAN